MALVEGYNGINDPSACKDQSDVYVFFVLFGSFAWANNVFSMLTHCTTDKNNKSPCSGLSGLINMAFMGVAIYGLVIYYDLNGYWGLVECGNESAAMLLQAICMTSLVSMCVIPLLCCAGICVVGYAVCSKDEEQKEKNVLEKV